MSRSAVLLLLVLSVGLGSFGPALAGESKADETRQKIREAAQATLAQLYKSQPRAKAAIEKAAGYAVFNNFGMKIMVAGGGSGKGIAVDNKTMKETFMKMVEVQAGLGFGVKKFSLIWVFETPETLGTFVNSGWELGGQASAGAKAGERGASLQGALSISPGIWLYQLTNAGLALELTAKGTKYYKDGDLN